MVDSHRAEAARTFHLRPVFECRTDPVVLAVATVGWRRVVDRRSGGAACPAWHVRLRLGPRAVLDVPDQSLRSVWFTPGLVVPAGPSVHHASIRNARTISPGPPSALRGLALCFLEHTHDDFRSLAVRNCDERLHPPGDSIRRTRPRARAWRYL